MISGWNDQKWERQSKAKQPETHGNTDRYINKKLDCTDPKW